MREADTPEEKEKARRELEQSQKELKKDWGPDMPKDAGEGHRGGRGEHEGGRGGHEGGRGGHEGGRGGHEGRGGHGGRRDD